MLKLANPISFCLEAYEQLQQEGLKCRVVSLPSWHIFEKQDESYRNHVLPPEITARISVEQAATFGWEKYVGENGRMIGMTTFGASAPLEQLLKKFGFTVDNIVTHAKALGHTPSHR
jgi:transketolase